MASLDADSGRRPNGVLSFLLAAFSAGLGLGLGPATAGPPSTPSATITFRDIAAEAGVRFQFANGSRSRHDLPEVMGGGVALIDGDGDGWLDLFFCNGGPIVPETNRREGSCRYYRNQRDGTFADATETAHAPGPGYAMGAAVGDVDGDGRDDLFVTGWRGQRLYHNLGGGRFEDVTGRAGLNSQAWSTSAALADLDGDGDLDLYVANYVSYDPATAPFCAAPDGCRDYCGPEEFAAEDDRLYRNEGDGTFTDVSRASGIALTTEGRGLGVLVADLTGDARLDIFVANDGTACWLFENRGTLRFEEIGAAAGVAFDGRGNPLAGMGVAAGDLDGDGRDDLVVGNFLDRSTVAFLAKGRGTYVDASASLGLWAATRRVVGFGVAVEDFDGDGRLDLVQANGHVLDRERLGVPFAMRPSVLRNDGQVLVDASAGAGAWFDRPILGRGLAVGDLDRDGRPDIVVNPLDAPAAVLRNTLPGARFVAVELVGRAPRLAVGARVRATVAGRVISRAVVAGGSYLSSSDHRLYVGLGDARRIDRLEVTWPSGRVEQWSNLGAERAHRLEEGRGAR